MWKKTALNKQLCDITHWTKASKSVALTTLNSPPNHQKWNFWQAFCHKNTACHIHFTVCSLTNADAVVRNGAGAHPASIRRVVGAIFPAVKRPGCESDHQPPSSAEVNACSYTSASPYAFMTWWLTKHCGKIPLHTQMRPTIYQELLSTDIIS